MHETIAQFFKQCLAHQLGHHQPVLHLGQAYECGQFTPHIPCRQDRLRNTVALGFKARPRPVPLGNGRELVIVFQRIVERIEQVFDIPEHHDGHQGRENLPPHSTYLFYKDTDFVNSTNSSTESCSGRASRYGM